MLITPNQNVTELTENEVAFLHFPKDDVFYMKEDKLDRELKLKKIMLPGSVNLLKIRIYFEDIEGCKQIETSISDLSDAYVTIANGVTIPTSRIYEIELN